MSDTTTATSLREQRLNAFLVGDLSDALAATRIEELEAKLAKALEALERIAHASDFYSVEANAEDQGADTLAYAHKSTCNLARTTLAELKGETDE